MAVYGTYVFSHDPDVNKQECISFFSELLGPDFSSLDEIKYVLPSIYINGQSLKDKDVEDAANLLRESLDIASLNVAMLREADGSFRPFDRKNFVDMRDDSLIGSVEAVPDAADKKAQRDIDFINYMNNIDVSADSSIIKVRNNDNDLEFIKNVTGMDDLDESSLKTALDSIFINGHCLSEKLGKDADLDMYAREVRQALSPRSTSFVTVMRRNSVFAQPKAVLPDLGSYDAEPVKTKVSNTLGYVKSFRSSMSNEAGAHAANFLHKMGGEDTKLFFSSLFSPQAGHLPDVDFSNQNLNLSAISTDDLVKIDPERMCPSIFMASVKRLFKNISGEFVSSRSPQNVVYAYMLTRTDPRTQKNFELDDILNDESEYMKEQKRQAGLDFCRIFQRVTNNEAEQQRNIDHYNEETYPVLQEITKRILEVRTPFHELNNTEDVKAAYYSSLKSHIVHDCVQQIEKTSNLGSLAEAISGMVELNTEISENRLEYMKTDEYVNNNISDMAFKAAATEDIMEHCGLDREEDLSMVFPNTATSNKAFYLVNKIIRNDVAIMRSVQELQDEDLEKFINREPNAIDNVIKSDENKKLLDEVAEGIKKAKAEPVHTGAEYEHMILSTGKNSDKIDISLDSLQDMYMKGAEVKYSINQSKEAAQKCDGACVSIVTALTGCPVTKTTDKKLFKTVLDSIYINTKSAAEYFGIDGEPDYNKMKDIEKELVNKILNGVENNSSEFISLKYGENDMRAVKTYSSIYKEPFKPSIANKTPEQIKADMDQYNVKKYKYERYVQMNAQSKKRNDAAETYTKLISATANGNELRECAEKLAAAGIKAPGHYVDFAKVRDMANENRFEELATVFTAAQNAADALNMANKLIINGKPVSEIRDFKDAADDNARIRAMGNIIKQAINDNMDENQWAKPIMLLNDKGLEEPVKFTLTEPKMPKKVEKLTGLARFLSGKEVRNAFDDAYKTYPDKLKNYEKEMAIKKRLDEYNITVDMRRAAGVRKNKGIAPTVRATNVAALDNNRTDALNNNRGNSPANEATPFIQANGPQAPGTERGMTNN